MRLLNSKTLELCEFSGLNIPPYAILSHMGWRGSFLSRYVSQWGIKQEGLWKNSKVLRNRYFRWLWVCLGRHLLNWQNSSTELSEAINSKYRWYKEARVCYIILSNVPSEDLHASPRLAFRGSRWFTRGWTLQELIAPTSLIFHNK